MHAFDDFMDNHEEMKKRFYHPRYLRLVMILGRVGFDSDDPLQFITERSEEVSVD